MHEYPQNQSYVGSRGQTLTTNVYMILCDWQTCHQTMSYVAALHWVPKQIRYQINMVPTPTVAWTSAWLIQGGGGGLSMGFYSAEEKLKTPVCNKVRIDSPVWQNPLISMQEAMALEKQQFVIISFAPLTMPPLFLCTLHLLYPTVGWRNLLCVPCTSLYKDWLWGASTKKRWATLEQQNPHQW